MDRRPALTEVLFQSIYFLEVEPLEGDESQTREQWRTILDQASSRVRESGNEVVILGAW